MFLISLVCIDKPGPVVSPEYHALHRTLSNSDGLTPITSLHPYLLKANFSNVWCEFMMMRLAIAMSVMTS